MGSKRLPALSAICLFCCLACVGRLFVVCHLSKHFSAVHSVVIVFAGDIRLLFKLLLMFRNVLKHNESRGSCNQNIKEDTPTALEVSFAMKRNETTYIQTDPSHKRLRNARAISAEELGTMSKIP